MVTFASAGCLSWAALGHIALEMEFALADSEGALASAVCETRQDGSLACSEDRKGMMLP